MTTPRIGILGAGAAAEQHAAAFDAIGSPVAAVCDLDAERARRLAVRYDAEPLDDPEALLSHTGLDAIVVAVPNHLHQPMAIRALEAGKDVLLEKPMGRSLAECDAILEAVNGSNRRLQMGFVTRHAPAAVAAKRFIDEGRLGRIYHVRASLCRRRGIPGLGRWFTTKSQSGGGVLLDLGVHLIDLAMHLVGRRDARRVSGACSAVFGPRLGDYLHTDMWAGPPDPDGVFDVEDTAFGLVRFGAEADGVTLELNTTWAVNLPEGQLRHGIFVLGDRGGLYANVWANELVLSTEQDGYLVDTRPQIPGENAWAQAWRNQSRCFAGIVAGRGAATATAGEGRAVQVVLDALYESSRQGREVEVG